jgi:hypothetical protein
MHYQTGSPLTATASQAIGLNGSNIARRANIVAGQSIGFSGTCSNAKAICWVNPNAFSLESPLGAGDAPVNDIIGPDFYQWDLSLRKTFRLFREGMSLQFQADAFNAFKTGSTGTEQSYREQCRFVHFWTDHWFPTGARSSVWRQVYLLTGSP